MAYITTAEVKEIRKALKEEFANRFKFSVVRRDRGLAVTVAIMAGKVDYSEFWKGKSEDDYGYGYTQLNPHTDAVKSNAVFAKIIKIIKTAPAKAEDGQEYYDNSDPMTDYSDVAFFFDLQIGKWDKPYEFKG